MIMCRNLEVAEVKKFEAMLAWAKNKIKTKTSSKLDAKLEFKVTMERLSRDLKLYRITPHELIKVNRKPFKYSLRNLNVSDKINIFILFFFY